LSVIVAEQRTKSNGMLLAYLFAKYGTWLQGTVVGKGLRVFPLNQQQTKGTPFRGATAFREATAPMGHASCDGAISLGIWHGRCRRRRAVHAAVGRKTSRHFECL
jgi:hypothetical protein